MSEISLGRDVDARALQMIDDALERARAGGAEQAEIGVSQDVGLSVTSRLREIETIEFHNDRGFGITVYVGQRKGSASTSDYSREALDAAVDKALYIARQTSPDKFAGLADADRMARDLPDLQLDHAWDVDVDRARDLALDIESSALDADSRISNSDGATVSLHRGMSAYGNSHGFRGAQRRSRYTLSCSMIAGSGDQMQRDYYYSSTRNPARLARPEEVGATAAARTLARLQPRKIATRQAPVIYRNDIARGFIGHLLSAIAGSAQYRRSSFLLDAVGQQVLPTRFSIVEQPHLAEAAGSTAYDSEGVATAERAIVADGVLQGYVLSSYSARRLGLETTANAGGVHNATVSSSASDLQSLMAQMGEGLLITELMGQGVNAVTGDYSRGAAGFWIENGEIAFPVSEITVAGNLRELYAGIVDIGSDVDERGNVRCGSVLVDSMTIAGS